VHCLKEPGAQWFNVEKIPHVNKDGKEFLLRRGMPYFSRLRKIPFYKIKPVFYFTPDP
jgi:hypothetical protein